MDSEIASPGTEVFVMSAPTHEARQAIENFARVYSALAEDKRHMLSEERIAALLDVILPEDPIRNARRDLEIENAKLRAAFFADNDCFTAAEISEMAGHDAKNRSVTASRWKADGRIFSVSFRRSELYPAFQFREGRPHPAIAPILAALPEKMTGWQKAFWFVSANGWLDGARPFDRLQNTEAVVAAAARESQVLG